MTLLGPPVELALARDGRAVPEPISAWSLEPKVDGWRSAIWTTSGFVQSRRGNNLAARFPEIVAAAAALGDAVLDGELVALRDGKLDFGALTSTPSGRAAAGVTVYFVAFDLLSLDDVDWRGQPYDRRRRQLTQLLASVEPPLQLCPATHDRDLAAEWLNPAIAYVGIEGVVAKRVDRPYRPGRMGDWVRIRHTTMVDAVVIGVTGALTRPEELVLARRTDTGDLRSIGLSLPLSARLREQAAEHVMATGEPRVRVSTGVFGRGRTEYRPVHPTLVVEVEAEASVVSFASRLRPTVRRLRPDLTVDDLDSAGRELRYAVRGRSRRSVWIGPRVAPRHHPDRITSTSNNSGRGQASGQVGTMVVVVIGVLGQSAARVVRRCRSAGSTASCQRVFTVTHAVR